MKPTDIPATITAATSKREAFPNLCQWFLKCTNAAEYAVPHPILGDVPTCGACVDKLNLTTRQEA